jgi:hypothetical protein
VKLPAGFIGGFVRIRFKINVANKLFRFVSITKDKKGDWYQLKYKKLPVFCGACGSLGHWYQECGTREHEESKLEWGDFIPADAGRGRGRGWGGGRGSFSGRAPPMGRGRGRSAYNDVNFQDPLMTDDMEEDEELRAGINARKRLTFGDHTNAGTRDGNASRVAGIVNQLEPGPNGKGATMGTPGKFQQPKRTKKDTDNETLNLSAASSEGAVREQ